MAQFGVSLVLLKQRSIRSISVEDSQVSKPRNATIVREPLCCSWQQIYHRRSLLRLRNSRHKDLQSVTSKRVSYAIWSETNCLNRRLLEPRSFLPSLTHLKIMHGNTRPKKVIIWNRIWSDRIFSVLLAETRLTPQKFLLTECKCVDYETRYLLQFFPIVS